jgi:hypothetical protein
MNECRFHFRGYPQLVFVLCRLFSGLYGILTQAPVWFDLYARPIISVTSAGRKPGASLCWLVATASIAT